MKITGCKIGDEMAIKGDGFGRGQDEGRTCLLEVLGGLRQGLPCKSRGSTITRNNLWMTKDGCPGAREEVWEIRGKGKKRLFFYPLLFFDLVEVSEPMIGGGQRG